MRLPTAALAAFVSILPAAALAQDTAPASDPAPAASADPAADAATEIDRIRADFRARFVDYDLRLKALETRIEALEKGNAEPAAAADGAATEMTSEPATPETAPQP